MDSLKLVLLFGAFVLAGCDKLSGAVDQQDADANAIGYACRISQKQPEACMKENETFSPSMVLDGWRAADRDVQDGVINVGKVALPPDATVVGNLPADSKPADSKPVPAEAGAK